MSKPDLVEQVYELLKKSREFQQQLDLLENGEMKENLLDMVLHHIRTGKTIMSCEILTCIELP
jgi:hypothetical protein